MHFRACEGMDYESGLGKTHVPTRQIPRAGDQVELSPRVCAGRFLLAFQEVFLPSIK